MRFFRKRPVVIEASDPISVANIRAIAAWAGGADYDHETGISIKTLEGTMVGAFGDRIIRGVKGEFYPCKPDIFAATYESVARVSEAPGEPLRELNCAPPPMCPSCHEPFSIGMTHAPGCHFGPVPVGDGAPDGGFECPKCKHMSLTAAHCEYMGCDYVPPSLSARIEALTPERWHEFYAAIHRAHGEHDIPKRIRLFAAAVIALLGEPQYDDAKSRRIWQQDRPHGGDFEI